MLNPIVNYYKNWGYILAIISVLLPPLRASNTIDTASQLKTILVSEFDKGFVKLAITNVSDQTLNVSPEIEYQIPPRHPQPGCIYVSMIFTKNPNAKIQYNRDDALSMIKVGGPVPSPVSIAPGETKLIKFPIAKYVTKIAKASTESKVILTCDKSTLKTILSSKVDDVWKIKN
jgi:hypothetical protein